MNNIIIYLRKKRGDNIKKIIKKLFPLLLVTILIICISSVSAEENTTKATQIEESKNIDTINNNAEKNIKTQSLSKVYVSPDGNDTNNGTKNSPKATIKDAVTTAKTGGTIYLKAGTYNESGIKINKTLKIIGENITNTIINSQNKQTITITANVNLKSFTIKNAQVKSKGGAIHNKGVLKLEDIIIQTSTATTYGGAIYNEGRLTANRTIFTENNASYGGAIYNTNRTLLVNCSFTKNRAKTGSSIFTTSYTNIHESNFTNNQNTPIYIKQNNETYIKTSKFTSNNASIGGAIYNKQSKLNINNVTFKDNTATVSGGAIYNTGSTTIKNSAFNLNYAKNGGAIINKNTTTLTNNTFKDNTATKTGGAIYNTKKTSLKNNTFEFNQAENGGAIYTKTSNDTKINIVNSHFTGNIAHTGGAIFVYNHTILILKNSEFILNSNNAIYLRTDTLGNYVYNTSFTENSAVYGGAIRNAYTDLKIKRSTFSNNDAKYGGALHNLKGNININYNIITDNTKDIYNTGNINANYNWWGSNTINKNRTTNTKVNKWIYLTMTTNRSVYEKENITTIVSLNNIYNGKNITKMDVTNKLPPIQIKININGCGIKNKELLINQSYYKLANNFTKAGFALITAKLNDEKITNNITVHKNIKDKVITGLYVQRKYDLTSSHVKKWVNAGITDVYVQSQESSNDTALLRKTINLCKNTGIRVHAWVICFKNGEGKFDMSNTRQTKVKNFIKYVISINGVAGVSLDYVRYGGLNPSIVKPNTITNFVKSVYSIVKSYDKNLIVSAAVFAEKSETVRLYGQNYTALSPYLDVMLPMTYRYAYSASRTWLKEATQYVVDRAPYSQVVSVVQTYYENLNKIPVSVLEKDIKSVMNGGSEGYVLFRQGLISSFPRAAYKL